MSWKMNRLLNSPNLRALAACVHLGAAFKRTEHTARTRSAVATYLDATASGIFAGRSAQAHHNAGTWHSHARRTAAAERKAAGRMAGLAHDLRNPRDLHIATTQICGRDEIVEFWKKIDTNLDTLARAVPFLSDWPEWLHDRSYMIGMSAVVDALPLLAAFIAMPTAGLATMFSITALWNFVYSVRLLTLPLPHASFESQAVQILDAMAARKKNWEVSAENYFVSQRFDTLTGTSPTGEPDFDDLYILSDTDYPGVFSNWRHPSLWYGFDRLYTRDPLNAEPILTVAIRFATSPTQYPKTSAVKNSQSIPITQHRKIFVSH